MDYNSLLFYTFGSQILQFCVLHNKKTLVLFHVACKLNLNDISMVNFHLQTILIPKTN